MEDKKYSLYLEQACDLLNSASDIILAIEERTQKSIELAELLILDLKESSSKKEKNKTQNLSNFLNVLKKKKTLFSHLIDLSFRSTSSKRVIDQISHLIAQFGIPKDATFSMKFKFRLLKILGCFFPKIFTSFLQKEIIKESLNILCFTQKNYLEKYLEDNKDNDTIFWLIQKPSFGKKTVSTNIQNILKLIQNPKISSLCINVSNLTSYLSSNLHSNAKEELEINLKLILQAVLENPFKEGKDERQKLIFLNFDRHRNLNLTIEIFEKVLSLDEFLKVKMGITLKAYFPESFEIQKKLIDFAKKRVEKNGCEIILRITKGSSLNLEQIEASKNNWPSPTFTSKIETDANFKKMIELGCKKENIKVANLYIATCNIFDIAYTLFLFKEYKVEKLALLELSEERSTKALRNSLEKILDKKIKISCPIINKKDFHLISFFLLKKINDFTNPDNFIYHLDLLYPGTKNWDEQLDIFKHSIHQIKQLSNIAKRQQNRNIEKNEPLASFENEPITDFSLPANQNWANQIYENVKKYTPKDIPSVINAEIIQENMQGIGIIPSSPDITYRFNLATQEQIQKAIITAKQNEKSWENISIDKKLKILLKVANLLKEKRAFIIQMLMIDISKTLHEADLEISDAIDAIEYQCKQMQTLLYSKDIEWSPKGTFIAIPPWGFPVSGGVEIITSALISSNCVIFKPPHESVLVSYELVNIFWLSGVPKEVLQFVNCSKEIFENTLVTDKRINSINIATSSKNVIKLIKLRKGKEVLAYAGGINTIIVTDMSDKEQAILDIINSAFVFSGQKFSSAPVLILEKNIYDDLEFQHHLKDAALNLKAGSVFDKSSVITPLIKNPGSEEIKALTTLEKGEWWLVKPIQDPNNKRLFSCGIKYGVKPNGFTAKNQLYCPLLSVIRAENLDDAIKIANSSNYGLAAGLQSLDVREHNKWLQEIKAGNYYINSKITDAKIKRQPFGGYKDSSFGSGYKSGGPNYILDFLNAKQQSLPKEKLPVNDWVATLSQFLEKMNLTKEQLDIWLASVGNYAYWWKRFKQDLDFCKIFGQDNYIRYRPKQNITLRITEESFALDALRVCAAALTCSSPLEISWSNTEKLQEFNWIDLLPILPNIEESDENLCKRIASGKIKRLRLTTPATDELKELASKSACTIIDKPVLANGRFELMHYIKEISVTYDYHRYGNLGARESDMRKPLL